MFYFIGNPTHDTILAKTDIWESIGGGVVYASLLIKKLGYKAGIIGNSDEYLIRKISSLGINITHLHEIHRPTRFINIYTKGKRVQYAIRGDSIKSGSIPEYVLFSQGILLIPVLDEIDLSPILLKKKTYSMVDISGFLRVVRKNGEVVLGENKNIMEMVKRSDIIKCNITEARVVSNQFGIENICKTLFSNYDGIGIITVGKNGAYIIKGTSIFHIPPYTTEEKDPTGAGDVFGAAFFVKYMGCKNIMDAGLFASAAAHM